jgi:hypothetical protein
MMSLKPEDLAWLASHMRSGSLRFWLLDASPHETIRASLLTTLATPRIRAAERRCRLRFGQTRLRLSQREGFS